jgi:hypothetical protein
MYIYTYNIQQNFSARKLMEIWIIAEVQVYPPFEDSVKHSNSFPYFVCLVMRILLKNQQLFFKAAYSCCFCNYSFP